MHSTEYGKLIASKQAQRVGSFGVLPPGQTTSLGIGFSGEIKPNTATGFFASRIAQSKSLQHDLVNTDINEQVEVQDQEVGPVPSMSYKLHNYNLKYFMIRQLLEQKDIDEIADMRQRL